MMFVFEERQVVNFKYEFPAREMLAGTHKAEDVEGVRTIFVVLLAHGTFVMEGSWRSRSAVSTSLMPSARIVRQMCLSLYVY